MTDRCLGCDRRTGNRLCRACWRLVDIDNRREINMAYDEIERTVDPGLRETALIRFKCALSSAAAAARLQRAWGFRRAQAIGSWSNGRALTLRYIAAPGAATDDLLLDFGYA